MARRLVRLAWLMPLFAVGACGSSRLDGGTTGTGGTTGLTTSPGTVTFILATAPSTSYCDEFSCTSSPQHLSISAADGTVVDQAGFPCGATDCATCTGYACPEVATIACPAPQGIAFTGGTSTWDGAYNATSTCGAAHTTCGMTRYMPPGRYMAEFCATTGTVTPSDGGLPQCSTGPTDCAGVWFDFPSATPVQLSLPSHVTAI